MCGIAGILGKKWSAEDRKIRLAGMFPFIRPRGPDSEGEYHTEELSFAHARLRILDLSSRADQPMLGRGGNVVIVYNGEIYNYLELRQELETKGYAFETRSDTEVIIAAYETWGQAAFERFNGMFAFALYDKSACKVLLARDRFGKKPLFYKLSEESLIFSSTLSALVEGVTGKAKIDPKGLIEYTACGYTIADQTLFEGICKVLPGEIVCVEFGADGALRAHRSSFWQLQSLLSQDEEPRQSPEDLARFVELLRDSVKLRLLSDRPLGLFLSGGVDSSVICALSREHCRKDCMHAFCCAFSEGRFSEHEEALLTAEHLKLNLHVEWLPTPDIEYVRTVACAMGEPIGDSSFLPMHFICGKAKEYVDVVLSGDGGDEILAGYSTYAASHLAQSRTVRALSTLPGLSGLARSFVLPDRKVSMDYKIRAFLEGIKYPHPVNHFAWRNLSNLPERKAILNEQFLMGCDLGLPEAIVSSLALASCRSWLRSAQYVDFLTWLPSDILTKIDSAGMAHGLELRAPYLDYRLVAFAFGLSDKALRRGGSGKMILREAARGLLPHSTLSRRKQGFNAPVNIWLRTSLRASAGEVFSRADDITHGLLRGVALARMHEEHVRGRRDNGYLLWSILTLLLWMESHC